MPKDDQKKPEAPLRKITVYHGQNGMVWIVELECGHRAESRTEPGRRIRCFHCFREELERICQEQHARVEAACARLGVQCVPAYGGYLIAGSELLDLAERLA